ncbi:MAG: bifunctional hydroxymethylpyrimidine kinase/phosphomethylpyrimidine kinase [Kiritimatiellia bacterium]
MRLGLASGVLPSVLSVAGSDSGGGAGVQADLRAFGAFGVHGCTAIAALTAQNGSEVLAVHLPPEGFLEAQLEAVARGYRLAGVKVGMLGNGGNVGVVCGAIRRYGWGNVVVDPVLVSTSGRVLLEGGGVDVLRRDLLPLARVVTPNLAEAGVLAGYAIGGESDWFAAGRRLAEGGGAAVLLKGGHWEGGVSRDVLVLPDGRLVEYGAPRVERPVSSHGTGCSLSAALAAALGKGMGLEEAVAAAKAYVLGALRGGYELAGGGGVMGVPERLPVEEIRVRRLSV